MGFIPWRFDSSSGHNKSHLLGGFGVRKDQRIHLKTQACLFSFLAAGYTQKTLAKAVGISQPFLSQWKNGDRSMNYETVKEMVELLNISVEELIGVVPSTVSTVKIGVLKNIQMTIVEIREFCSFLEGRGFKKETPIAFNNIAELMVAYKTVKSLR